MEQASKTNGSRTTQYVLLTVLAVMIVTLSISIMVCSQAMTAETHMRYLGVMNVASEKIAKTIRGMEMNANNVFDEVEKHMDTPESVIAALESKTSLNPDVRGYFAAFEPDYFQEKGRWFEPYIHHSDTSEFELTQVGSARHDYTKSDWYVRAKKSGVSFWSDPYYYYDGTNISGHYCTYVKPVFNANGKLACICGADMTFEWLTKELQQIDDQSKISDMLNILRMSRDFDFYTVIVNSDGSCIAHPEGKNIPFTDENVIRDLAEKKSGIVEMDINGVPSTVYYRPIDYINWSVAVITPKQGVLILGLCFLATTVLGMTVIWLVSRRKK